VFIRKSHHAVYINNASYCLYEIRLCLYPILFNSEEAGSMMYGIHYSECTGLQPRNYSLNTHCQKNL